MKSILPTLAPLFSLMWSISETSMGILGHSSGVPCEEGLHPEIAQHGRCVARIEAVWSGGVDVAWVGSFSLTIEMRTFDWKWIFRHSDTIYNGIADNMPQIIFTTAFVISSLAVCLYTQWDVTLVIVAAVPLLVMVRIIFSKVRKFCDLDSYLGILANNSIIVSSFSHLL